MTMEEAMESQRGLLQKGDALCVGFVLFFSILVSNVDQAMRKKKEESIATLFYVMNL
jgi:hypothetical protein